MTIRGPLLALFLSVVIIALAGCADCGLRYESDATLQATVQLDKTLRVAPFTDQRPSWEMYNDFGYATSDLKCDDIVRVAVARNIAADIAKSGMFRETVYGDSEAQSKDFDYILDGEIRHLYAQYQQRWLTPGAFPFIFVLAPFYIPREYASGHIEIHLVLTEVGKSEPIWSETVSREWAYGPMTAFGFMKGDSLLYEMIREKLQLSMTSALRSIDTELAMRREIDSWVKVPDRIAE